MGFVGPSLRMVKLDLAVEKTGVVPITNRRKNNTVKIQVGNHVVVSKSITKYLGGNVLLSCKWHLNYDSLGSSSE